MVQRYIAVLAWLALGYITFVTLSPIGLRPVITDHAIYERVAAYFLSGLLFGLAYPRRFWTTLSLVVGAAMMLEALQHLTPDRHGHISDFVEKASGGWLGVVLASAANRLPWFARSAARSPNRVTLQDRL